MADEFDTPAEAGTEDVHASEHDTSTDDWDYFDPDEDQDTEEAQETEETEDEAGDEPDTPDEVDPEDSAEEQPEEAPEEAAETSVVQLPDGTQATVGELTKGYLRQADYSRKTAEVAEQRKAVEADVSRFDRVVEGISEFLSQVMTPEPAPELAYQNPQAYAQQKARADADRQQLQAIVAKADDLKGLSKDMSETERRELVQRESRALTEALPHVNTPEKRAAFFKGVSETAQTLGFSQSEMQGQTDHRLFVALDWAAKGMAAEKAKASAKAKVAAAPKVPAKKPGQGAAKGNGNREAMKRLAKSGSMEDALKVEWE